MFKIIGNLFENQTGKVSETGFVFDIIQRGHRSFQLFEDVEYNADTNGFGKKKKIITTVNHQQDASQNIRHFDCLQNDFRRLF